MILALQETPEGMPAGVYATGPEGLYILADNSAVAGHWLRYRTPHEIALVIAKGWDETFNCLRPTELGGGWMRLSDVLSSAASALADTKKDAQ